MGIPKKVSTKILNTFFLAESFEETLQNEPSSKLYPLSISQVDGFTQVGGF